MVMFDIYNNKRRTRNDIIVDILSTSVKGANKSKIVWKVNLNFKKAAEYINYLVELELLVEEHNGRKKIYRTTEKGMNLLEKFRELTV